MVKYYYVDLGATSFYVLRKKQDGPSYYYNKKTKVWARWPDYGIDGYERLNKQLHEDCKHKTRREAIQSIRLADKKAKANRY